MGKAARGAGEEDAPKKKQHRKKNAKLIKKRTFKRNIHKFKANRRELRQIKRDKDELRKFGYINKAFSDKVPCDKILEISQTLQKLIKHSKEQVHDDEDDTCEADLTEMFNGLDEGAQIDLAALEDQYVQAKLLKLFSLMRLQHGKAIRKDDRLKFQKRQKSDLHDFQFSRMIQYMLKRANEKLKEKQEEGDKDSEGDGIESSSSDGEDMRKGGRQQRRRRANSDDGSSSDDEGYKKISSGPIVKLAPLMKTVDSDSDDDSLDIGSKGGFLLNTMGLIKEKDEAVATGSLGARKNEFANDMDALFGGKKRK